MGIRAMSAVTIMATVLGASSVAIAVLRWTSDHVMIIMTAGDAGAAGFDITLSGKRERTGSGPGVFAIGLGHSKRGGAMLGVEQAGAPLSSQARKTPGAYEHCSPTVPPRPVPASSPSGSPSVSSDRASRPSALPSWVTPDSRR